MSNELRPPSLSEFSGQDAVTAQLSIALKAAKLRNEPLEHALFCGPPGCGKTTLSHIVAHEMGATVHTVSGPTLTNPESILGIFMNVQRNDVLFIDEIHRIWMPVEEMLYSAMEDFKLDVVLDKGQFAKPITFPVNRFTLIGATTRMGDLSSPLRMRFGLVYQFELYPVNELVNIATKSALKLMVGLEPEAALMIAQRSRGTPRVVNRLLRRCRDFAHAVGQNDITVELATKALLLEGVDERGLTPLDYKYLEALLRNGGIAGVDALAANINETAGTLVDVIEPWLLREGYVQRTRTGRKATEKAREFLGVPQEEKKAFALFG